MELIKRTKIIASDIARATGYTINTDKAIKAKFKLVKEENNQRSQNDMLKIQKRIEKLKIKNEKSIKA